MNDKNKSDHPRIWRYRLVTSTNGIEIEDLTITRWGAGRLLNLYLRFGLADRANLFAVDGTHVYAYALPAREDRS